MRWRNQIVNKVPVWPALQILCALGLLLFLFPDAFTTLLHFLAGK